VSITWEAAVDDRATSRNATEPRSEHETFGKRQAIEAEDEIDGKLGASAIADLAHVKALGK
jgi:hypothetical protein